MAWSPGVSQPLAAGSPAVPLAVDTAVRNDVVSFYQCIYGASQEGNAAIGWTGNLNACGAGTTTEVFKDHVRRRINWFRAMAGMPADIVFDAGFNAAAQASALIMAKERDLSHDPEADFGRVGCWTAAGQTGASKGNLSLGSFGVEAIDGYMDDYGIDDVGHRAWILYPRITRMGTGDVPGSEQDWTIMPSNCLYVIDNPSRRPASGRFHAWPPPGYVPADTVYPLWSLLFDSASFGSPTFGTATVNMTVGNPGTVVPVQFSYRYAGGGLAGAPSLVWEPDWTAWGGKPPLETPIRVSITGIAAGSSGSGTSHTYTVTCIDPSVITDPLTISGPTDPPATGASYQFPGLTGVAAERYELAVAPVMTGIAAEGAEATPPPRILDQTSSSYPLMVTPPAGLAAQSGSQCFHLTLPDFADVEQSFGLDYVVLPATDSRIQFHRRLGWMTPGTRVSLHLSSDEEPAWREIWGRNGPAIAGAEAGWTLEDLSLAAWAGQAIRLQFRLSWVQGAAYVGTSTSYGVQLDTITLMNTETTGAETITALPAVSRSFTLDAGTAGGALTPGGTWLLRIRPVLGPHTFGFASPLRVKVAAATSSYATWLATRFPGLLRPEFGEDPDGDGLVNGVEYAFGLDPAKPGGVPPTLTIQDGAWVLAFDPAVLPYAVSDLIYGAESSPDLSSWTPLAKMTTAVGYVFPLAEPRHRFGRWRIDRKP